MDASRLGELFERLDAFLQHDTELVIGGGAAVLAHGLTLRVTVDIDVLPVSRFVEADLRQACAKVGLGFNPDDKAFAEGDYLEVVPEETLHSDGTMSRIRGCGRRAGSGLRGPRRAPCPHGAVGWRCRCR